MYLGLSLVLQLLETDFYSIFLFKFWISCLLVKLARVDTSFSCMGRNPPLTCDARIFSLWWWLRNSSAESSWGGCCKLACVVAPVYAFLWASVVSSAMWRVACFHAEVRLVANLTVRTIFPVWTWIRNHINCFTCPWGLPETAEGDAPLCFQRTLQFPSLFPSSPANKPVYKM